MPQHVYIFNDEAQLCHRSNLPAHYLHVHMWLIDRLNGYLHFTMWETWWTIADRGLFEWKPSNVKRLTKLIRRSCSVLPKPQGSEYIMICHMLRKADEMTAMVYATVC